ncbi:plasminogen-binding N-terminal domain-containing protein [Sulfurimonas sp. SAG-AH-194-C21]|nr:plasminogen-binding N-terminal domain-containing protein [Sulfurimonas sp. SAG-AH-194-C21]MDF1882389.1 plasminogen-binding N-terminal domain-containing protein [Sulfurimonas sp. SAG-AH-194-C21]
MKHLFLLLFLLLGLSASMIKTTLLSIDYDKETATVKLDHVDVGVSGFLVHSIAPNHTSILKNIHVVAYNKDTKIATLSMDDFNALQNNALPSGKWKAVVGDGVELAFGYSRSMLIAPSEEIYHRITQSVQTHWVHIDIFATIISYRGHPTPLKNDFDAMNVASSVGLLFIYLDKKLYTIDIKTFVILSISDAPLVQDTLKLPFYSRVPKIAANWWGEGSSEIQAYEPYYFGLLKEYNPENKELVENIAKFEKGQEK